MLIRTHIVMVRSLAATGWRPSHLVSAEASTISMADFAAGLVVGSEDSMVDSADSTAVFTTNYCRR